MTTDNNEQKVLDNIGHRRRVRQRFWKNGGDDMADYELLEFVLMQAIPRRDVKPIAKELLRKFGSFAQVIYAPATELQQIAWVKESTCIQLKLIAAAVKRICREHLNETEAISLPNIDALIEYARAAMAYSPVEELRVVYLNAALRVIGDELIQKGTLTEVITSPRAIVTQALENKAAGIILIHNHPSDNTKPSHQDDILTSQIKDACNLMGITLHDHIITGRSNYYSYHEKCRIICG